jgi:hypothetical protein
MMHDFRPERNRKELFYSGLPEFATIFVGLSGGVTCYFGNGGTENRFSISPAA